MSAELKGLQGNIKLDVPAAGVGRDPGNQLVINDSETSWHHAQIVQQGQGHNVIDLGSRNGTFVNGQRLLPNTPRSLRDGDTVRFGNTMFTYINESLRYTPTRTASPSYTPPPPPPPSTPEPRAASPSYRSAPASFQQQSPPATPPIVPEKKEKSDTPRWVTIVGGLASLATIFGLIFTIYTATHSSPTPPTPGPSSPSSSSPASSIPRLHESYTGILTHTDGSGGQPTPFNIFSLTEDDNGNFTATGSDGPCSANYKGTIQQDNSIDFTATEAANTVCGVIALFSGKLFSDGHLEGQWQGQGAFSSLGGSWTMQ